MASAASSRLRERLNALLAESEPEPGADAGVRSNGSVEGLEATLFDALEAELRPGGALAEDIATALRSSLGADDRRVDNDANAGGASTAPREADDGFAAVAAAIETDRDANRGDPADGNRRSHESLISADVAERIARALRSA